MSLKLKNIMSWTEKFCLMVELQADPSKGIPRRYKLRSVPVHGLGGQRLYPEGMIPVISDDNRSSLLPEDTAVSLCRT